MFHSLHIPVLSYSLSNQNLWPVPGQTVRIMNINQIININGYILNAVTNGTELHKNSIIAMYNRLWNK